MSNATLIQGVGIVAVLTGALILVCVWLVARRDRKTRRTQEPFNDYRLPPSWRPDRKTDR